MAGGVPAGRLSIEIVAEIARLQADLDKAKRAVRAASGDIAQSTRAMNDNFERAGNAAGRFADRTRLVGASAANQRAGLQQLGFQLGDVATQYAAGTSAMVIFAQQSGQVVQALGMMTGSTRGLLGFLGGPWGAILGAAAVALTPLIGNLFKTADAADTARGALAELSKQQRAKEKDAAKGILQEQGLTLLYQKRADLLKQISQAEKIYAADAGPGRNARLKGIERLREQVRGLAYDIGTAEDDIQASRAETHKHTEAWYGNAVASSKAAGATRSVGAAAKSAGGSFASAKPQVDEFTEAMQTLGGATAETLRLLNDLFLYKPAQGDGAPNTPDWIKDQVKAQDEAAKARDEAANDKYQKQTEADQRAVEALTRSLQDLANAFDQLGSGTLGNIAAMLAGFTSEDFSGVRGAFGGLLQTLNQSDAGKGLIKDLTKALDDVFGDDGSFTSTMNGVLQHAGLGLAAGSLILGKNGSKLGSSIGGAIGGAAATAFLGAAAGPLGALAGGILGGVVGNLLKSNRTAGAVLTGPNSMTIGGKDRDNYSAASDLGSAVLDSLNRIADAFGATLGSFQTAIGVRGDQIRVNANGTSLKFDQGAVGFGQDSAAALKFAIKDAISDGAFEGLSDGVKRLLNGEGDIEAQIQKALSFQGVFDELEQLKDPQAYQLKQLDEWRKGMDAIFAEAGATADELAKLEELTGLKRKEIVEKYGQDIVNAEEIAKQKRQLEITIMELEGKSVEALAAVRDIERSEADASLRPLYDRIYALQDAKIAEQAAAEATAEAARIAQEASEARIRAAQEEAQRLAGIANERYGLETQLLQIMGDTDALRARELEKLDPSNRALQERIWALEDEKAAVEASTGAMQDAARALMLAGDGAGYVAERMREAMSGATGDKRVDAAVREVLAAGKDEMAYAMSKLETILNQNARAELSANALMVQNIGQALEALPNLAANSGSPIGKAFVATVNAEFAKYSGGRGLYGTLGGVMGEAGGRAMYGDMGAMGVAGVRAAREQLGAVSQTGYSNWHWNDYVNLLGEAADGLLIKTDGMFQMMGADVEALTKELGLLSGQLYVGNITVEEARTHIEGLIKTFPELVTVAQSLELQIERVTDAANDLVTAGLGSIEFYFDNLSDMTAQLAQNGSAASETLNTLGETIGRMNSFATVFSESADAARQGMKTLGRYGSDRVLSEQDWSNLAAADAIAAAAKQAAGFLITEQSKAISAALADDAAFAGVSPELRKTAALLLEGIGAYDIPSFEAAFIRMSDALAKGTITVDQFNALFAYSRDVVTDAAKAAEEAAKIAEEAASRAMEIAKQSRAFDIRIAELTLGERAAELMRREDELKALDPSLHAKQQYIWALEDEAAAAARASDATSKLADFARDLISELSSIIDVLDGGLANLIGQSEVLRQAQDTQAMRYLRGISGVPNLDDTFKNAVNTVSSLSTEGFGSQFEYLREIMQRSALLGDLRGRTEDAREDAEQALAEAQRKMAEQAAKAAERQEERQAEQIALAKTTNEKFDLAMALLQSIAASSANTSDVQDKLLAETVGGEG